MTITTTVPGTSPAQVALARPKAFHWPYALRAAAMAVLIAMLPLSMVFSAPILAFIAAGLVSVAFYLRKIPIRVDVRTGFRLGMLTGAMGFAVLAVLTAATEPVTHDFQKARQAAVEQVQQMASSGQYPESQQAVELLKTPLGLVLLLVTTFVLFLLISGLGGLLGALVLGRIRRQ